MKRISALIICLLLSSLAFSQDNEGFFKRIRKSFTVHDTVYIYIHDNDTIVNLEDDDEDDEEEDEEFSEGIAIPIDTLNTTDRYTKVVLFDNGTWL